MSKNIYAEQIELFNAYINGELTPQEKFVFQEKLESDSVFQTLYSDHLAFLRGMERVKIKQDIAQGFKSYNTFKIMKIAGVALIVISVIIVLAFLFNKDSKEITPVEDNTITTEIQKDTVTNKDKHKMNIVFGDSTKIKSDESTIQNSVETKKNVSEAIYFDDVELIKPPQKFYIKVEKDTVISCKEGTVLKISPNSFVEKSTGKIVTGTVKLEVTEYYKTSDMLLANLSTRSNDNILETGGMLNIKGYKNERELELAPNKTLQILFPTESKKKNMKLFSGSWKKGNVNWELQKELDIADVTTETSLMLEEEVGIEVPFAVVERVPIFPDCDENKSNSELRDCIKDGINKVVQSNFNLDIAEQLNLSGRIRINVVFKIDAEGRISQIQTRAPHPLLDNEARRVMSLIPQMKAGQQRGKPVTVPYSLPIIIDKENDKISSGNASQVVGFRDEVPRDTVYTVVRGKAEFIRQVMHDPNFDVDSAYIKKWESFEKQKLIRFYGAENDQTVILRKPLFSDSNTRFVQLEDDSITRGGHIVRKVWDESKIPSTTTIMRFVPRQMVLRGNEQVDIKEFEAELQSSDNSRINTADINNYAFSTSTFGWINCDRFIGWGKPRIAYRVYDKDAVGARVNMVFRSSFSILTSEVRNKVYDFKTVPKDEDVTLVAIKKKEGKIYLDMVDVETKIKPEVKFNFKEVSVDELKKRLSELDR